MRTSLQDQLLLAADDTKDATAASLMVKAADRISALEKELREQEREFQREARDIAAEARWEAAAEYRDNQW
jgi:hypothetical protein